MIMGSFASIIATFKTENRIRKSENRKRKKDKGCLIAGFVIGFISLALDGAKLGWWIANLSF